MGIAEHQVEVALDLRATLAEGPVWDDRAGELCFVDIDGGIVHRFSPVQGAHHSFAVGRSVGAVVNCEDGRLLLAAERAFYFVERDGSHLEQVGDFKVDDPRVRFNDGKVDPAGRFLAGTMHHDETDALGTLYQLEPGGNVSVLLEGITISNGLAWSPDGRLLYYIDTAEHRVDAFDVEPGTGSLSNRRSVAQVPDGGPDGMAIDDEGLLWVACWGGWRVDRIDPRNGEVVAVVRVPTRQVSSVAFGGEHLDQLYVTTARRNLDARTLAEEPHAGSLFVVEPGVTGPPASRFGQAAASAPPR